MGTKVTCTKDGRIMLGGFELTQREAVDLAAALAQAVQNSVYRSQMGTKYYQSTVGILARNGAPLGVAIKALNRIGR